MGNRGEKPVEAQVAICSAGNQYTDTYCIHQAVV